jgi:hypothetical protein
MADEMPASEALQLRAIANAGQAAVDAERVEPAGASVAGPRPVLDLTAVVLDWKDPVHHSRRAQQCRYGCGGAATHLRDADGLPAHKVCAEAHIERVARAAGGGRR